MHEDEVSMKGRKDRVKDRRHLAGKGRGVLYRMWSCTLGKEKGPADTHPQVPELAGGRYKT